MPSLNDVVLRWGLDESPPLTSYDAAKRALLDSFAAPGVSGQMGLVQAFPGETFNRALYLAALPPEV
jgi:hypothetical protein